MKFARTLLALVTPAVLIAGVTASPGTSPAAAAPRTFVLDRGHLDLFELTYDQGSAQLALHVKDDTMLYGADVAYRDPGNVTVDVDAAAAAIEVPDLPEYAFLGPAASTVYLLPQVQDDRLPWPGWSTQRLVGSLPTGLELASGSPVQYTLNVSGPGDLFTFAVDAVGTPTNRFVDTTDAAPDVIHAEASTHTHTNWAFTEVGDYYLTVTPSATTLLGGVLTGPARSYHFHVGEPLVPDVEGPALTVSGASPTPYPYGAAIELAANQNPHTEFDTYAWFRWVERPGSGGSYHYEPVSGGTGATLRTTATISAPYYVQLYAPNGRVVADASTWVEVDPAPPLDPDPVDPDPDPVDPDPTDPPPGDPGAAPEPDPVFTSIVPIRLADTRTGAAIDDAFGALQPGQPFTLPVAGRAGVPADASAAILNVTVADATDDGYLTIWPCDAPQPLASSLNFAAGWTVANSVVAGLPADRAICLATTGAAAHVVIDVTGYVPGGAAYVPTAPARLADTRAGAPTADGLAAEGGVVAPGVPLVVQVAGRGGVPTGADAAVLNVTVTEASRPGYVTVWACDVPQPWASTVNFDAGWTVANGTVAPLAADGTVCLTTGDASAHLIVDVAGSIPTGAGYLPVAPARLADSRPAASSVDGGSVGAGAVQAGVPLVVPVAGRGGVPADADAAVLNVTVTGSSDAGYVTVWPCDAAQPWASTVNFGPGWTIANGALAQLAADGTVCLTTGDASAHLVVDVAGAVDTP